MKRIFIWIKGVVEVIIISIISVWRMSKGWYDKGVDYLKTRSEKWSNLGTIVMALGTIVMAIVYLLTLLSIRQQVELLVEVNKPSVAHEFYCPILDENNTGSTNFTIYNMGAMPGQFNVLVHLDGIEITMPPYFYNQSTDYCTDTIILGSKSQKTYPLTIVANGDKNILKFQIKSICLSDSCWIEHSKEPYKGEITNLTCYYDKSDLGRYKPRDEIPEIDTTLIYYNHCSR